MTKLDFQFYTVLNKKFYCLSVVKFNFGYFGENKYWKFYSLEEIYYFFSYL